MSETYSELLDGATLVRRAPGPRHELICRRLHAAILASVSNLASTRLVPARTEIQLSPQHALRPDLALITVATGRLWLAAEIVNSEDHRTDTVLKKQIYEEVKLPRLWMIDPRYDNVEVYHATQYGLALKQILAGQELLTEKLIPEFQIGISKLFQTG